MRSVDIAPTPDELLERVRAGWPGHALGCPGRLTHGRGQRALSATLLRRAKPVRGACILASFSPFPAEGPFHEYGPGPRSSADSSGEEVRRDALPLQPPAGASWEPYLRTQFVLRAYSDDESIVNAEMASPETAGEIVQRFLDSAAVSFVHARFPLYGCFACRIDRG